MVNILVYVAHIMPLMLFCVLQIQVGPRIAPFPGETLKIAGIL